jgi:hypothetical protein
MERLSKLVRLWLCYCRYKSETQQTDNLSLVNRDILLTEIPDIFRSLQKLLVDIALALGI